MSLADPSASAPSGRRLRRLVGTALVAAFAARLLFGLYYWVGKPLTRDEAEYLELAESVASGHGFTYRERALSEGGAEPVDRAPLYPFFLAVLVGPEARAGVQFHHTPVRVKVVQAALGTVVVWIVAVLARRAAGPVAGAAAAWMAAIHPPLVWIPAYALSETLFAALALGSAAALGPFVDETGEDPATSQEPTRRRIVAAGVLGGLAALVRPPMLLFLVLIATWIGLRRGLRFTLAVALGALIVILPWTIRNAYVHGRFIPISAQGGVTFWTGNHPLSSGEGDLAANPRVAMANREFLRQHRGLSAQDLNEVYYREARHYIAQDPLWWAGLLARKFFYLWVPIGPSYRLHSMRYFLGSVIPYAIVLPLALAGFTGLWRRRRRPWSLWLLAASAVAGFLIYIVQERFRIPILDPTLIVGASAWIAARASREGASS